MTPVVSVVIPTYNNADYIVETLHSIFSQTYEDYEVILVDDGSTDSTRDVIELFHGKIRYHYQENQGLAVARNVGLEMATGEYVTFLDGDDIWHSDNLGIKVGILRKHPDIGGVFSDFSVFNQAGTIHHRGSKVVFPFFRRTGKDFPDIFPFMEKIGDSPDHKTKFYFGHIFSQLFWGNFILPSSMLFRKECAIKTGSFLPHMRTQQDYEYWLRFSKLYPLAYVDEVFVRYRRHPNQLTNHSNINKIFETVIEIISRHESEFSGVSGRQQFNRRKSELLLDLAKVYLGQHRRGDARNLLLTSRNLYPRRMSTYFQMALTFLPPRAISFMRALKRGKFTLKSYADV